MDDDRNTRTELVRLTQLLVAEGTEITAAFATQHALHHTDAQSLTRVIAAQDAGRLISAGELAEQLRLTSGAITAMVDRLERAGHVARVREGADRRKVLLRATPGGRELAEEFFVPLARHTDAAMDQFTAAELDVARRFLAVSTATMATYRRSLTPQAASRPVPGVQSDR